MAPARERAGRSRRAAHSRVGAARAPAPGFHRPLMLPAPRANRSERGQAVRARTRSAQRTPPPWCQHRRPRALPASPAATKRARTRRRGALSPSARRSSRLRPPKAESLATALARHHDDSPTTRSPLRVQNTARSFPRSIRQSAITARVRRHGGAGIALTRNRLYRAAARKYSSRQPFGTGSLRRAREDGVVEVPPSGRGDGRPVRVRADRVLWRPRERPARAAHGGRALLRGLGMEPIRAA